LRAERRAGQLLAQMEKATGARGNPNGRGSGEAKRSPAPMRQLGPWALLASN